MENQNFIQFKRARDLGSILSDTIRFFSIEWKPFLFTILKVSIIPILIAIAALIYFTMSSTSFVGDLTEVVNNDDVFNFNSSDFTFSVILYLICYLVAYALITVSSLSYIKSYITNKGLVNYEEINKSTKEKFASYLGLFFLNGLIVVIGALFCLIPGIYFGVVLSLSFCLLIFQNKSITDSIGNSFMLIKDHWWETFGILLVIQILIAIIGFVVSLPSSLYYSADLNSILSQNENAEELLGAFEDPVYILLLSFSYFVNFILYIVTIVSSVFIYYDIKEQKNPSSDLINEIGHG